MKKKSSLTLLGAKKTIYPTQYSPRVLEAFENKNPDCEQWVTFNCPEFTSLCPMTQQPDFANIIVNYIPDQKLVESKSLKLYLFSFRNHGDFHENCVQTICNDLFNLMKPCYIEVIGEFTPRGGISIHPFSAKHNGTKKFASFYNQRMLNHRLK